ncbi:MAG: hypothetical protein KF824_03800 [Fimbriimonadaceae bacterium]|nr:MAG: hypothetical protein KF824_03800 [Fimbriimonadaceae bacterium]
MRSNKVRGHTLMEAMFSAFLALVCALIFTATVPFANFTRGKADNLNAATSLAQKTSESIRGGGYANSSAQRLADDGKVQSSTAVSISGFSFGTAGETALEFTTVDAANVDSPAAVLPNGRGYIKSEQVSADLRRVTVIIAWQEKSVWKSVRLATLIANL